MSTNQVVEKVYGTQDDDINETRDEVLAPFRNLKDLVIELLDACDDPTDSDNDTLPDKVEWVIGTDHENPDSDFDKLNDTFEAMHGMDPLKPDSNMDGIADLFEVKDVPLDVDGDGIDNAWDRDNDNDGISDKMDLSPFHVTKPNETFHFSISSTGRPLYLDLQLRPENPDHLRLIGQTYNWPKDNKGTMRDLDDSEEDVVSTPLIDLEMNIALDSEPVADYGIAVNGDRSVMSVSPVNEEGMVVAFQGKVFIPPVEAPRDIEIDMKMRWKITGMNDFQGVTLDWNDARTVVVNDNGSVRVEEAEDGTVFLRNDLGQDRIALKDLQGRYLTISDDGSLRCDSTRMTDESAFEMEKKESGFVLRTEEERYLQVNSNGSISAIKTEDPSSLLWQFGDKGVYDEPLTLAVYDEDIIITGFTVEECYGTGVGMVYGDDLDLMNAANLALTYDFMRNSTNMLDDVPAIFEDHNLPCSIDLDNFDHTDEAMRCAMGEMKDRALESLPEGEMLPITLLMDDRSTSVYMTDLINCSNDIGSSFSIDMEDIPVIRTRVMKSSYYEMPSDESLGLEEVMNRYRDLDMDDNALETILWYTVPWIAGDQVVISVGPDVKEFSFPEQALTSQTIQSIIEIGITSMTTLHESVLLVGAAIHLSKLAKLAGTSMFSKGSFSLFKSIHDAMSATDHAKFGTWNKFGKCLLVLEVVIAVGMSIFALISIGNAYDWSAVGTGIAIVYSVMMLTYSIVLIAIGMAGPVGFVIALLITLSDLIVGWICGDGWFQQFLEWFIGLFTDFNERSTVDLEMGDSTLDIDDKDGNGLTAGDRITYTANSTGIVTRTSDGHYNDVVDSYIEPHFRVAVPARSRSTHHEFLTGTLQSIDYNQKRTSYTSGFWVEPGVGMVNFPTTFWLESEYRVYYEECWWFFGWHCDREYKQDSSVGGTTTMYFDVMPGDIDEFGSWRGIVPLDADGDGINNTDEKSTHPWKWDTDGDGLCDKLEMDFGSDPTMADTDLDGIFDGDEFNWWMDPNSDDTDSDGMSDFMEHKGWVVNFEFCGRMFNWTINSDPRLNDTDGDGLSDRLEYLCKLNPRTADTDGDGKKDSLKNYYETSFEYRDEIVVQHCPQDMIILPNGTSIVLMEEGPTMLFAANGSYLGRLKLDGETIYVNQIERGPNGTIIVSESRSPYNELDIHIFNSDLTYNTTYTYDYQMWARDMVCNGSDVLHAVFMDRSESYVYFRIDITNGTVLEQKKIVDIPELSGWGWCFSSLAIDEPGNIYFASGRSESLAFVKVFDPEFNFLMSFGSYGTGDGQFQNIVDMSFVSNGDILIADSFLHRIQKLESDGRFIAKYGVSGPPRGDNYLYFPDCVIDDGKGSVYVCDNGNHRIKILYHNVTLHEVNETAGFEDTDGDGLSDLEEEMGHVIEVESLSRSVPINATSDPHMADTDGDGLDDLLEWNLLSDPRSPDTDGDGIPDIDEFRSGTNLSDMDTDGDGLPDGQELVFFSSLRKKDTDGDGLDDKDEFDHGTDPNNNDTDQDGLTDKVEVDLGWDPLCADPDGDFMFDSAEMEAGTSWNDPDKDRDGLIDGFEGIYQTDPLSGDSDGDLVPDGFEVEMKMSPINNDTDGDGLLDGREMKMGSNPLSSDSDGDGIKDSEDLDFTIDLDEPVMVVHDNIEGIDRYLENLSSSVNITILDPSNITSIHDSKYIVLVGRPSEKEGTAGNLTRSILPDDILDAMEGSDMNRFAMRYGEWIENQTIVMLSTPYDSDHYRTLGMLRSMSMTVGDREISARYLNPRCCFSLDMFEIVTETGTNLRGSFHSNTTFEVDVKEIEMEEFDREKWTGLEELEVPLKRAVEFEINGSGFSLGEMEIFYRKSDLDRSGDGISGGPGDIDESTIRLYFWNESSGKWEPVTGSLSWVEEVTLNTTDFSTFGMDFSGKVNATVGHLSVYALAGRIIESDDILPVLADPGLDRTVFVDEMLIFDGSNTTGNEGILNYTWSIAQLGIELYGPLVGFTFNETGYYNITLEVTDYLGLTGTGYLMITVVERTPLPMEFTLTIGPLMDEYNMIVKGAEITISWNGTSYTNSTGVNGTCSFGLSHDLLNRTVSIRIIKEGYYSMEVDRLITSEGELDGNLPLLSVYEPDTEGEEEDGVRIQWVLMAALLLLLLLIVVLLLLRRKKDREIEE